MTGFVIYSMGDPDFIRLALLGLSHAFEQGALSLAKIGLLLGLLAVFWQGVWNPGKIEFKQFFIGFFLVIILFGKSVPVTLIHGDGVGADAMPPIPIGIALGGTIATNFGHAMADSLRQFYHTAYVPGSAATGSYRAMIGVDGGGVQAVPVAGNGLQPFRELMKLRFDGNLDAFTSTSARAAAASKAAGGVSTNVTQSIENYMSDCVLKDIYNQRNVQEANEEAMRVAPWAWESMKVSYNGWTTSINVDAGHGWKGVGCGTAYSKITNVINTEWKTIAQSGGSTDSALREDLAILGNQMLGSTNAEAWKIKVNQVLMYHFKKAKTRSRWASQSELMASQAEFEALDKRRVSTGVQYSLWSEMAIPLMTYIEAFVFLIGPLMPFIVAFGEKGAGMVLKYFFLLIWVNTWPILQVGVNMYLQNAINKASFGSMSYDAFSWSGFNTSFTEIESFIAMGSTLQTMVPALSLMLLYGSVHTAINMSNSAQKAGGSEGAMATPKAAGSADSGKVSVGNNNYAYDANVGGVVQSYGGSNAAPIGMSQNNTKTDLSAATSNNIQAAKTQIEQASTTSTKAVTDMLNQMEVGSDGKSMQLTENATRSQGMQRANAYADSLMKIEGMNEQDAKTLGLALAGGMGVKAQAEAAAALGFSAKAGKADAGGEVSSSGKFGVGIKGEISAQATSKLDTAISNVASLAEQKGNNWSFSNTEQGSAVLASAEQLSTSNATGNTAGFGKSGQVLEQSSKVWSDANALVESETRNLSAIQGFSGGTSYNLAGVTSDATQNRNDEKFADGSNLSEHARSVAFGAMNADQKADFDKFKKEGGYAKGLNGDIQALKDFSQTKEGASLAGMSSNFKTTQEYAAHYEKAIAADVGGDKSLQARREATGRYADAAFKNIMGTYGSERFEASAKFLDQLNANAGGKMANWAAAAADFRSMGAKAEQPLSMPAPQTAEQAGGPTAASVDKKHAALKTEAQNFVAAKGAAVTATNPNATHAANVQTVTQQNQADPNKVQEANELGQKVDARVPQDGFVEEVTQPFTQANRDAGATVAQLGEGVADVASTLNNWVNGTPQEQAAAQLVQDGNVSTDTAALMTGGGSQTAHSEIVDRMKTGLSENASPEERKAAIELMAASHAAGDQIESLRATGNAEDAKVADTLQQNANSVNAALKASPFDDTQKEVLKGLGEKVANGELSAESAHAGFEMMNNDKYDAAKTQNAASVATRGTSYRQLENNQRGGKAAMEVLESKGLTNSEEYKSLQQKTQDNQKVLDSHVKSRAVLAAQEAYRQVDGNHVYMTESRPIANAIISSSINGSEYKGLNDASINKAMEGESQDNSKSFLNFFKDSEDNIGAMKKYENVREGLVAASERLHSDPKMEQYANRLDATIAKLDKQTGFDQRVAEPKPSSTEAGGQATTGATNNAPGTQTATRSDAGTNDNGQATGGANPPASSQSTVPAQNTVPSNGTANAGSNENGNGTGDNPPASNQSTVTATNTDSSNVTTRTESGSNENNVQGNGGNQTTPSQSTVTAQNTVPSNGTANAGSNENGNGTGDNPPASNQSTVTATNTDSSNVTTRTESGSNENNVQGNGGNQTTPSQSTVTAQSTVASNGTANPGSNENSNGTGDNPPASNQSTVTATNTDSSNVTTRTESGSNENNVQGNGGNQTTPSQSTVTAQSTVASNGTANPGSNENGNGTGDNQTTSSEGAVTAQNTDSTNGTTRTESGSNDNNVQGNGGNQTTPSQSTVAAQSTVASNGTANPGSNENGNGTGDNPPASNQSTVTATNTDSSNVTTRTETGSNENSNGNGGNQTTPSQSTVTAQSTVASNGTVNDGSNENGEGTGDNQTTSSEGAVTAQNTDSTNGTTRTEAGSNENNVQGNGGNQTTSSQSTVAAQNTVASNGTVNAGSNENGEGTGDNRTTPSEGEVTTRNTDSTNGTTRTEAGSNENNVQGNGGNQTTSSQSTVTAQNTVASNGTANAGSNENGEGTGDNRTTPSEGEVTTRNTDSTNGTTRTEAGSNENNVQGNSGNQTTSNQSTVTGQNTAGSNESVEGTGDTQTKPSEDAVTTQSTDSNGTTRTETGSNETNAQGNGGTVAAQNTVSSNGSTSSGAGSNTDDQGSGSDNSTTSDQSTSAAQNSDSSNGFTRTDTGSNETNVQGTGGENQTTSSQSTVATQSNVASNGSTSTDAGSNTTDGQGAGGENQSTNSEGTMTTQSADKFDGSTRTDAGTNEVTGNESQSSAEQSTSASTGSENTKGNPTGSSENNDQGSASTNAQGTSNANSEGTLTSDSGNSVARGDTGTNNVSNEQGATNNPSNPSEAVAKGDNSKPGNEDNNEPAAEGKASNDVSPSNESVQSDPVTRSETGSNADAGSEESQSSQSAGSESTGDNTKPMTPDAQRISSNFGDGDRIKVSEEGFSQIQAAPEGTQMELGGETFTKVGGGENNGVQSSQLVNNESGEHHHLYQDSKTGGGNLSIESFGGFSRA